MLRRLGVVASLVILTSVLIVPQAHADLPGPVACGAVAVEICTVHAAKPGAPGAWSGGSAKSKGSSVRMCPSPGGGRVPCDSPVLGLYSQTQNCYYSPATTAATPPVSTGTWSGQMNGTSWMATCVGGGGIGGFVGLPAALPPPVTAPALPSPRQLAVQAVDQLLLQGPRIGTAPPIRGIGLIGVPVWLWTSPSPSTWGPVSATAAVPGLSVTATAHVSRVVWEMGDGNSVTCDGPGTPYERRFGGTRSPDCGYMYSTASYGRTNDAYVITATATWQVRWAGGGQTGQLLQERVSSVELTIAEMQVLITG